MLEVQLGPYAPRVRQVDPPILWGLALAVVVETSALHLVLHAAHPVLAWTSTTLGASSLVWLVARALRRR